MDPQRTLDAMIGARVRQPEWQLLWSGAERVDPVEVAPSPGPSAYRHRLPSGQERGELIQRRLGLIPFSERNAVQRQALLNSYAFPMPEALSARPHGESEVTVNESETATKQFVDELISAAHNQRLGITSGNGPAVNNLFVLHGARGVGKTTWAHYVLAKYGDYFDEHHVIWLRINTNDQTRFSGENPLLSVVYAELLRVLLRYFDPNSKFFGDRQMRAGIPLLSDLEDAIARERSKTVRRNLELRLSTLCAYLQRGGPAIPLDSDFVDDRLGHEALNTALEAGYGVIVLLDGLDLLEVTDDALRRFERLKRDLGRLAPLNSGLAFVAICRTDSADQIARPSDAPYGRGLGVVREIMAAPLNRVVELRIQAIKSEISALARLRNWTTEDWPAHIDEFSRRADIGTLSRFFGNNLRTQMQALQLLYHHFLEEAEGRTYLLLEKLMTMGQPYPPQHYSYRATPEGTFLRVYGDRLAFDSRFIPSVFAFPRAGKHVVSAPEMPGAEVMIGLRILQFVSYHEERVKSESLLTAGQLFALLEALGYRRVMSHAVLEEFWSFELLRVVPKRQEGLGEVEGAASNPIEASASHQVSLLPKAAVLLSDYVMNVAYLNLAAMRMPLGREAVQRGQGKVPFISAACLEYESATSLSSWITRKLTNSIAVLRVVREFDDLQGAALRANLAALDGEVGQTARYVLHRGMFKLAESMKAKIQLQAKVILQELETGEYAWAVRDVAAGLERIQRRWAR